MDATQGSEASKSLRCLLRFRPEAVTQPLLAPPATGGGYSGGTNLTLAKLELAEPRLRRRKHSAFATNIRVVEDTGVVAIHVAYGAGERNRVRARGEPGSRWEGVKSHSRAAKWLLS